MADTSLQHLACVSGLAEETAGTSGSHQAHRARGRADRQVLGTAFCSSGHSAAPTGQNPPEHPCCSCTCIQHTGAILAATPCTAETCSIGAGLSVLLLPMQPSRLPNIPLAPGVSKSRRDEVWFQLSVPGDSTTLFVLLLEKDRAQNTMTQMKSSYTWRSSCQQDGQ